MVRRVDRRAALQLGAVGLVFVVVVAFMNQRSPLPFVCFAVFAAFNLRQASLLLRVDASGVRLGRITVPWSSLSSVRKVRSLGEGEELELRLRPDARLPDGVRGIVRAPGETDVSAPELRLALPPGTLDRDALRRAVTAFGGGAVPVLETT